MAFMAYNCTWFIKIGTPFSRRVWHWFYAVALSSDLLIGLLDYYDGLNFLQSIEERSNTCPK